MEPAVPPCHRQAEYIAIITRGDPLRNHVGIELIEQNLYPFRGVLGVTLRSGVANAPIEEVAQCSDLLSIDGD